MGTKSIYDLICENITPEGKLPLNFVLPDKEEAPNKIRFAPGARDGIGVFHRDTKKPEENAAEIVKCLKKDWKKDKINAHSKVEKVIRKFGTLSLIDPILNSIRMDHADIDINHMFKYACNLAFQQTNEEMVKLGIALFGLLDLSHNQKIIEMLIKLSLFDEFTLYVVVALSNWENGNNLIFEIAKKVDGWGKIHSVERLEPTSEDIREWLLRKGCANAVLDSYLGMICATKGNLIEALRREDLDKDLFDGISVIINALLEEGPCDGISVYEHSEEALYRYLKFANVYAANVENLWRILNVKSWLEDAEISNKAELLKQCDCILDRESWRGMVNSILSNPEDKTFFYAANVAGRLGWDVSALIFEAIKRKPLTHVGYLSTVYKNVEYAKQLTELYEEILPLNDMASGMGDYLFAPNLSQEHHCLDFVLPELKNYPNMGERLVEAALRSPVVRERNGACTALEGWCAQLNQPLKTVSPRLLSILTVVASSEVKSDVKKRMNAIIKGGKI